MNRLYFIIEAIIASLLFLVYSILLMAIVVIQLSLLLEMLY
jgi:hypothetical protein